VTDLGADGLFIEGRSAPVAEPFTVVSRPRARACWRGCSAGYAGASKRPAQHGAQRGSRAREGSGSSAAAPTVATATTAVAAAAVATPASVAAVVTTAAAPAAPAVVTTAAAIVPTVVTTGVALLAEEAALLAGAALASTARPLPLPLPPLHEREPHRVADQEQHHEPCKKVHDPHSPLINCRVTTLLSLGRRPFVHVF
jgi:hypothetical protein